MYRINLLPEQYKRYLKSQVIKNRIIVIEGILLVALLFIYWILNMIGATRTLEYASVAEENKSLQVQADSLKQYDVNNGSYDSEKFIDEVIGRSPDLEQYLVLIANSAPSNIDISGLSIGENEDGESGTISGTAAKHAEVSDWINDISGINGLINVKITYLAKDMNNTDGSQDTNKDKKVLFEISLQIDDSETAVGTADTEASAAANNAADSAANGAG
jgi:hypothetical protein